MMVLLGRAVIYSYTLSVQTTLVSGAVWPQFEVEVFAGVVSPQIWAEVVVVWGQR